MWRYSRVEWALREAVPEVQRLVEAEDFWSAYRLAQKAQRYIPNHPDIVQVTTGSIGDCSIDTDPPGADVYVKSYAAPETEWDLLGVTPLKNVPIKLPLLRWRFHKEGFEEVESGFDMVFTPEITIPLTAVAEAPAGMVLVPKRGRGSMSRQELDDYWFDRYEVTNRQFQEFVDAGGYSERKYWKHPFLLDGREISWEDAINRFVGQSGRPGPATWRLGTFPEGQGDDPVGGVSWYEAVAYAEFVGKSLPTNSHWEKAAGLGLYSDILRFSNMNGHELWSVGSGLGIGPYGTYDMAGNVREWCWNQVGDRRYIRGGAWNEPVYMFSLTDAQPPFDRSETNGFRCVRYSSPPAPDLLAPESPGSSWVEPVETPPIDDEAFERIRAYYSYERTPLNAHIDATDDSHPVWTMETISFDAAYPGERMMAHLALPRNAEPPYQVVIVCPSGGSGQWPSSRDWVLRTTVEIWTFLLQTGRAAVFPVWKGSLERRLPPRSLTVSEQRDLIIARTKDVSRTLDYLETRDDIDTGKIGWFGLSNTSALWPVLGAIEPRIRAAALWVGGLDTSVDLITDFASRSTAPVLMLNGKLDFMIPRECSDRLFQYLGTPKEHKKLLYFEGGHIPYNRDNLVKETLDWFDRYLGPVAE